MQEFDPKIVNRLERQNAALLSLIRSGILQSGDLNAALRRILAVVAETLGIARVSIWPFDEARTHIRCILQHDRIPLPVIEGNLVKAADCPVYFRTIETADLIATDDAQGDPRTSEFSDVYLRPNGITSMMDVPVGGSGGRWGIVCHEHIGPARHWTSDEQGFALAVANLIWLAVEHSERKGVEARLQDYMDHAYDCMSILSPDARIVFANRAWHDTTGYSPADLAAGISAWQLIRKESQDEWLSLAERVRAGEAITFDDLVVLAKDGRELTTEGSIRPRMVNGVVEYAFVIWRDMTARKQNEKYRSYFTDHSGGIYAYGFRKPLPVSLPVGEQLAWVEEHGYLAECNSAVARIFGASGPDDLVGKPISAFFMDRQEYLASVERWIRSGYRIADLVTRALTQDGQERWIQGSNHGVIEAGHVVRAWGMATDVTARFKAETALRESEERFRQISENIREVFWLMETPLHRVVFVSSAYGTVFGRKIADLYVDGLDWMRAVHPEDRERVKAVFQPQKLKGGFDVHYRIVRPDGSLRWIHDRGFPVKVDPGETPRLAGLAEDVTSLKETEQALRESEKRLADALQKTEARVVQLEEQVRDRRKVGRLIGKSPVMQEIYRRIRLAAESDATVLITGESGTGKELAASAIHSLGARAEKPFIAVNCSAIPETLLESELFGHMKGAFTGAIRDKAGLVAAAEGGTLFLDEVADMSPILQVKLLRVLQEREYRRVGDEKPQRCNVRIVTATNRNLVRLLSTGALREDFYFRIRVFSIEMPPLHWRLEDIPLLTGHIVEDLSRSTGRRVGGMTEDALRALMAYPWPGNVRELRNALEGAFVTVRGDRIGLEDLPVEVRRGEAVSRGTPAPENLQERSEIEEALRDSGGNRTKAAAALGVSRVTLWKKMRKLGIVE